MRVIDLGPPYGPTSFDDNTSDADIVAHYDELEANRDKALKQAKIVAVRLADLQQQEQPSLEKTLVRGGLALRENAAGATKQAVGNIARTAGRFGDVPLLRDAGKILADEGDAQLKEAEELGRGVGGGLPAASVESLAGTAGASAPVLLAGPFGRTALSLAAGAQSYGSTQSQFRDRLMELNPNLTEEEAYQKSMIPAGIAAAATAALTRTFGGVERFIEKISIEGLKNQGAKSLLGEALKAASIEVPEEYLDQLSQGFTEKAFIDPNKPVEDIFNEAGMAGVQAFALGGLTTGAIGGVGKAADAVSSKVEASRVRRQSDEASRERIKNVIQQREAEPISTPAAVASIVPVGESPALTGGGLTATGVVPNSIGWEEVGGGEVFPPLTTQRVSEIVQGVAGNWSGAPKINVVETITQLPEGIRQEAEKRGLNKVGGVSDPSTGVWLVASNITDEERAKRLILHESIGHYGVESVFDNPAQFDQFMRGVAARHAATELGSSVKAIYGNDDITVGREVIAKLAENPQADPTLWQQVVAAVRNFARKVFNLNISDNDIQVLLSKGRKKIEEGTQATVQATQQAGFNTDSGTDAPVLYKGYQQGFGTVPGFDLFNLTETISPQLVKGSTVTADSLRKAGFNVPATEQAKADAARPATDASFSAERRPSDFRTRQQVEAAVTNPGLETAQVDEARTSAAVQSSLAPDRTVGWLMASPTSEADALAKNRLSYIEDRRYLSDAQQQLSSMPESTEEERRAKELASDAILGHYGVDRSVAQEIDTDIGRYQEQMTEATKKLSVQSNNQLKANFLTALFNHLVSDYRTYLGNQEKALPANQNAQAQYRQGLANAERRLNEHQVSPIAIQHALSAIAQNMPAGLTTNQEVIDWAVQSNVLQGVVSDNIRNWMLINDGNGSPALLGYTRLIQDMADLRDVLANQNNLAADIDSFEKWFRNSNRTGKVNAKDFAQKYFKLRTARDRAIKIASAIEKTIGDLDTKIHGSIIARDRLQEMMTEPAYVSTIREAADKANVVVRALLDSSNGKTGNGLIDRDSNVGLWRMTGPITGTEYIVDLHPSSQQELQNKQNLAAFVSEANDYATQNVQNDPLLADQYAELADYITKYLVHPSLDPSQGFTQQPWLKIPGTTVHLSADPFGWVSSGLTGIGFTNRTVRDAIERIGGRPVRQAVTDAYDLDTIMRKVQGIESNPKYGFEAQTKAVLAALKSHGWTTEQFPVWDEMIAEKFLASGQNNLGAKYQAGDTLVGSEGNRLTTEDIAALNLMKKFSSAITAAAPASIKDSIGDLGVMRKAIGGGEYTMARLPQSWTENFVNNWTKLPDDASKLASLENGRDFQRVVMGYIGEFNPEFGRMNPASQQKSPLFDIYRRLALREKRGVQTFTNLNEVLDYIADQMVLAGTSPDHVTAKDSATKTLLSEINSFIKSFSSNVLNQKTDAVWEGKPDAVMQVATANNAFTTPRGDLQAPSTFYTYSLATDGRRRGFVGGLRSLLNLKVIQSMREAMTAMRNKKAEMQTEIEKQVAAGTPFNQARRNVLTRTEQERKAGQIRYDYRELDSAIRYTSSVLEQMERLEVSNPDHYQHSSVEAFQNAGNVLKTSLLAAPQAVSTNTWGGLLLGPATLHWQTGQWGRAIRDVLPSAAFGNSRVVETVLKRVASFVADNPYMSKLLKKHAPLWNNLTKVVIDAAEDWAKVQRVAEANGMVVPYNVRQRWGNQAELKGSLGRFSGDEDPGTMAEVVNTILSAPVIRHAIEPVRAFVPKKFDDYINYSLILGFDKDLDMLKKRGWDAFRKREQSALPGQDWKDLSKEFNVLQPEDLKIGSYKGLNRWRELFAPLGSLDSVLLDYYEKTKNMTPEQREATPLIEDEGDYAGLALYYAGVSNVATETNRPQSYKGKGTEGFLRSAAGTFAGWGANFMHQLSKGLQTYSKDPKRVQIQNNMIGLATIILLLTSVGLWNVESGDELNKLMFNKSSARIQLGNATQDPATGMAYLAQGLANTVPVAGPIIGSAAGLAFTGRGSPLDATSQILYLNFVSDSYKTAMRIMQTGDASLPMADWTRRWIPFSSIVLNRVPVLRGLVDQQNAIRSMNGSAPPGTEIKWGQGGGGQAKYGPVNSEIQKLIGAAYEVVAHGGSMEALEQRRADAIAAFVKTGRSEQDATKAVDAALAAKEPIKVLTGKEFTEEEEQRWVARMTASQKADYDRAVAAWKLLSDATGKDLNMTTVAAGAGGGGGGTGLPVLPRVPGMAGSYRRASGGMPSYLRSSGSSVSSVGMPRGSGVSMRPRGTRRRRSLTTTRRRISSPRISRTRSVRRRSGVSTRRRRSYAY